MASKTIDELRKQKEHAESEVKRLEKEISQLEATERSEKVKKVKLLMHELGVSLQDLEQNSKQAKKTTKQTTSVEAVFRNPKTGEMFANRGSYGRQIQKLLDEGIPFEDIVIDQNRVESLKAQFERSRKKLQA